MYKKTISNATVNTEIEITNIPLPFPQVCNCVIVVLRNVFLQSCSSLKISPAGIAEFLLACRLMVQVDVGSIPHGRNTGVFLIQPVHHDWYNKGAYKRSFAGNRK